jgi:hypothetical protein
MEKEAGGFALVFVDEAGNWLVFVEVPAKGDQGGGELDARGVEKVQRLHLSKFL